MVPLIPPCPQDSGILLLQTTEDVIACRQMVGRLADQLGFSVIGKAMLVTAASELSRNAVVHGGGGRLEWSTLGAGDHAGIRLIFADSGPGIPNLELAMSDGWTSGGGLGLGLPGAKRLVHEFAIESSPGMGTRVVVARWRKVLSSPRGRSSPRI